MFDSRQERVTWDKPGLPPEERVFRTCFHERSAFDIIEEAENVIVLRRRGGLEAVHVWVYTSSSWHSCRTYRAGVWEGLTPPEKIAQLQDRLRFLKSLAQ